MPIVFVHGVNNRDGEAYRENEKSRDAFLKEIVAPALGLYRRYGFVELPAQPTPYARADVFMELRL